MAKVFEQLDDRLISFINAQKVFFVGSAPLAAEGHVNLSPKGYDSLAVIDPLTVAWIDLGGSGIETLAHTRENGRMTLMFCAFEGPANILRLYGTAKVTQFDEAGFGDLLALFPAHKRARNIFVLKIDRIADACGWGVPFFDFVSERDQLRRYTDREDRSADDWAERYHDRNATSIDGLPGISRQPGTKKS